VPAELTWWQRTLQHLGVAMLIIILVLVAIGILRLAKILRF
jgi:hypothetical protein